MSPVKKVIVCRLEFMVLICSCSIFTGDTPTKVNSGIEFVYLQTDFFQLVSMTDITKLCSLIPVVRNLDAYSIS